MFMHFWVYQVNDVYQEIRRCVWVEETNECFLDAEFEEAVLFLNPLLMKAKRAAEKGFGLPKPWQPSLVKKQAPGMSERGERVLPLELNHNNSLHT